MNKKILMGSILAVAILILVSFAGVVGYQTTNQLTIAKTSPLFTVRSSRAIDEDSKNLSCDYVGKGEECTIYLGKRPNFVYLNHYYIPKWTTASCTIMDPIWTCVGTGLICLITIGPICSFLTSRSICEYITNGIVCDWIANRPLNIYYTIQLA
jgi:hypothetical protein